MYPIQRQATTSIVFSTYTGRACQLIAYIVVFLCISGCSAKPSDAAFEKPMKTAAAQAKSIHEAALLGHTDIIRQHISAGTDINEIDDYGSSPLIIATTFGKTYAALALIAAGADLEIRNKGLSTPLHLAAFFGHTEIVRALLANGANKYSRNNSGSTAFDIVVGSFEDDVPIYNKLEQGLGSLGLVLDHHSIKASRPIVARLLEPSSQDFEQINYHPVSRQDWQVSTPAEQGLDPQLVAELYLDGAQLETLYSLLVIKNGLLIAEGYFNKGSIDQKALLQSVSKSVTSALVGIAREQGCLADENQKMLNFFPEIAKKITDPRKQNITVKHLLQMRGGYPWEETDPALWKIVLSGSYLPAIEEIPLTGQPGTLFNYSNLSTHWLGVIVCRACNTDLRSFAKKHLFSQIDSVPGPWLKDHDGYHIGFGEMHFTAREMAKFGLLYLNEGKYRGQQIISTDWVKDSLQNYSAEAWVAKERERKVGRYFRDLGYGYQWWSATAGERRFNFAWGHGGQLIILLKELDMMIVTTSYPFYAESNNRSWRHERSIINVAGKFIRSLPN